MKEKDKHKGFGNMRLVISHRTRLRDQRRKHPEPVKPATPSWFHRNGRLTETVLAFPDGPRLVKVHFIWPCFNCGASTEVDRQTFQLLESKSLLGVPCRDCLTIPPDNNMLRVA